MSLFKKKITTFTAMLAFLSLSSAMSFAVTHSDVIKATDNMSLSGNSNLFNVDINGSAGAVGQVDYHRFNVGSGERVNFGFSDASQTIINRVLGGTESQILGQLTNSCTTTSGCVNNALTGKVILINPAGVVFGNGSLVDLNSFTASTFDFNGAKNLNDMTAAERAQYQSGVLNNLSPLGSNGGKIFFDSKYVSEFEKAGINIDKGSTFITLDGTQFAHFNHNADGSITRAGDYASTNTNKSVAIVSDNITYKDSVIRTGGNYSHVPTDATGAAIQSGKKSQSNVRLITADGVTFGYANSGYVNGTPEIVNDTNTTRQINIDNSGLAADTTNIQSGDVIVHNASLGANSNVKIKDTFVKGYKLIKQENGNITIAASGKVDIENSRIQTYSTTANTDEESATIKSNPGGKIQIVSGSDTNIDNSLLFTASHNSTSETASDISLSIGGNANITDSKLVSHGNLKVDSDGKVTSNNSVLFTDNDGKNLSVNGIQGVDLNNSIVASNGSAVISSKDSTGKLTGDINIVGTATDGKVNSLVSGMDKLSILGANTTVDNALLSYADGNLNFYGDGTTGTSNVTIKNSTQFTPITASNATGYNLDIETNGNLTFENANPKVGGFAFNIVNDANGNVVDNGTRTAGAISHTFTNTGSGTPNTIKATSTQGNVNVNNSKFETSNKYKPSADPNAEANSPNIDIQITANAGNVNVDNSTLNAQKKGIKINANKNANITDSTVTSPKNIDVIASTGNVNASNSSLTATDDVNIIASKGTVNTKNNTKIKGGNDVNITSYNEVRLGKVGSSDATIAQNTDIEAGNNVNITSTNSNIKGEKTTMPTIKYGKRLKFDAKGNNEFTSEDSLKSVNVDYIAGGENNFTTKGDIQFVNSSLKAPKNNITTTQDGDVIMNNLTIKSATANAKDTVTKINAKGNVTTKDVTKSVASDLAKSQHTFPQSVVYNENGSETGNQVLDINQTKLVINTKTPITTPKNNTDGSIIIDVKNANNKEAGLELTAENTTWDKQIEANEGPEVHLNAVDDELAISKIVTDKLFLKSEDKMYAAPVQLTQEQLAGLPAGTPSKGYIEVRDKGGFNMDNTDSYDPTPDDFKYTGNFDQQIIDQDVVVDENVDVQVDVTVDNTPEKTTTTTTTTTTTDRTTTTTTTTTDKKHTIEFDNDGNPEDFILVYDKTKTEVDVQNEHDVKVDVDVKEDYCPAVPESEHEVADHDSLIVQIRIPKEQVEISKTSKVSDNTVDQTSSIMSAAAKVDVEANAAATESSNASAAQASTAASVSADSVTSTTTTTSTKKSNDEDEE